MNPYEILIRFDENGKYKGGHTIRFDPVARQAQEPKPIGADKDFPWPDQVKSINEGVAARVSELEVLINDGNAQRLALQAEKDNAEKALAAKNAEVAAGIAAIHGIVADPDTDTEKGILAFLHEATKDERTKQADALDAQIVELQAKRDSLK